MLLHNKLIGCFPTNSTEKVEVEIGYIQDLSSKVITEKINCEMSNSEFVALIEEKIDQMNHLPTIKVHYPFGTPKVIIEGENVLSYNQFFININFK